MPELPAHTYQILYGNSARSFCWHTFMRIVAICQIFLLLTYTNLQWHQTQNTCLYRILNCFRKTIRTDRASVAFRLPSIGRIQHYSAVVVIVLINRNDTDMDDDVRSGRLNKSWIKVDKSQLAVKINRKYMYAYVL